jgi:hypothetical protein
MFGKIVTFMRDLIQPSTKPVSVVFVKLNTNEWMAYVTEMPAINGTGSSAAQALAGVQQELRRYGKITGNTFTVQPENPHYQQLLSPDTKM